MVASVARMERGTVKRKKTYLSVVGRKREFVSSPVWAT